MDISDISRNIVYGVPSSVSQYYQVNNNVYSTELCDNCSFIVLS